MSTVGSTVNKSKTLRTINESSTHLSQDDQKSTNYLERHRLLSAKVERCLQELIERVYRENSTLNFELLAPPASHVPPVPPNETREFYFDFYIVWKSLGKIEIERDLSSVCCKIKYLTCSIPWSRAEQDRLLISSVENKRFPYINGRGLRDLFFETLRGISPDLIRLDFVDYLIFFDLMMPSAKENIACHITLLPCIHLPDANEVLLPYGTLRWYPRSLLPFNDNGIFNSLQQPIQNISIRRYLSANDASDTSSKYSREDQQAFARVRTLIHELLLPCTMEHVDSIEQLRIPFEGDEENIDKIFFLPHRTDRNCNVFPAGQYLLDEPKAKRFFYKLIQANTRFPSTVQIDNNEAKV